MTRFRGVTSIFGPTPTRSIAAALSVQIAWAFRPHSVHNLQPIDCVHEVQAGHETPEQSHKQESRSSSKMPICVSTGKNPACQTRYHRNAELRCEARSLPPVHLHKLVNRAFCASELYQHRPTRPIDAHTLQMKLPDHHWSGRWCRRWDSNPHGSTPTTP